MDIALVTDALDLPAKADDRHLEAALTRRGVRPRWVVWDDPAVGWAGWEAVLLRSPWDYITRPAAFRSWVARVDGCTRLFNPARLVLPNLDKAYLRALEAAGVPLCPTLWLAPGAAPDLQGLVRAQGWGRAFLKPTVGAGASGTLRLAADLDAAGWAAAQAHLEALLQEGAVMVQPYLRSVESEGEFSLILIEGELCHGVVKRPLPGDYRVQASHGASDAPWSPPAAALDLAHRALAALPERPLYARVDLLRGPGGEFVLNELELTEPALFWEHGPASADRLADALLARLG